MTKFKAGKQRILRKSQHKSKLSTWKMNLHMQIRIEAAPAVKIRPRP
jgi:hypothetical protein